MHPGRHGPCPWDGAQAAAPRTGMGSPLRGPSAHKTVGVGLTVHCRVYTQA